MPYQETLDKAFREIGFPDSAREYLLSVWRLMQAMDDLADGDAVSLQDARAATWDAFVRIPANSFFQEKMGALVAASAQAILKWETSDNLERAGKADAKTFMWRAGYYDLVTLCGYLCGLGNIGETALTLYGETLDGYLAEHTRGTH